ncbi:MAG TPA: MaoC family dehydratase N-terminal domain-containing protein [Actinomycetota bacterium]|nr:MaoC family dehydratase N-terminal domain-containing protein [Actinomycetota bacterium]
MNPKAAGKVYPDVPFTVDPERVRAFRAVFDEPAGVPATFATAAEFTVIPEVVADPELGLDFSRVLHGNQEYEFRRPLREEESLVIRARIDSIREMGGNGFMVLVTELIDPGGEIVCTARSTLIERADA